MMLKNRFFLLKLEKTDIIPTRNFLVFSGTFLLICFFISASDVSPNFLHTRWYYCKSHVNGKGAMIITYELVYWIQLDFCFNLKVDYTLGSKIVKYCYSWLIACVGHSGYALMGKYTTIFNYSYYAKTKKYCYAEWRNYTGVFEHYTYKKGVGLIVQELIWRIDNLDCIKIKN